MDYLMATIMMFGGNFPPRNWAFCNGQLLSIAQHSALFSLIGTTYGGDGRSTFGLPDLRGRAPIHTGGRNGTGPGLSTYSLGQRGGEEGVTLSIAQIPNHYHLNAFRVSEQEATISTPTTGASLGAPGKNDGRTKSPVFGYNMEGPDTALNPSTVVIGNTGGGLEHTNIQPYLAVNYIICTNGLYPSRN